MINLYLLTLYVIYLPHYPNRALHSQAVGFLVVLRVFKSSLGGSKIGGGAYSFLAPLFPVWIWETDRLSTFKIRLRTFLFDKAFRAGSAVLTPVFLSTHNVFIHPSACNH